MHAVWGACVRRGEHACGECACGVGSVRVAEHAKIEEFYMLV